MNTSPLAVASLLVGVLAAVTALSMLFLVLWQAPTHRNNQLLAAYMGTVFLWSASIVMFRLTDGNPIFFSVSVFSFGLNGFSLFALVTHYLDLWHNWRIRLVLAAGIVLFFGVVPLRLWLGGVYDQLVLTDVGRDFQLSRVATLGLLIPMALLLISTLLLWRFRATKGTSFLAGTVIALFGVVSVVIPLLDEVHTALVALAVSSVLFTRAILQENLFNPLADLNRALTASEAHYRALSQELSRKEKLYRTLARNLPNTATLLFDETMHCLVLEGQLPGMPTRLEGKPMEGSVLWDVLPDQLTQDFRTDYQAVFAGKERTIQRSFGDRDYQIHLLPVKDEHEAPFEGMVVIQDVSDMKRAEREALDLRLEKERVHILRKFISDASHDLLTPLTNMNLVLYLLQRSLAGHPSESQIPPLEKHTSRLISLVNDMLEVARLDDSLELDFRPWDVNELVEPIVKVLAETARERGQTLAFHKAELPAIPIDAARFERAVTNVITNAIMYTPQGGSITVSTSRWNSEVVVEVQDSGIGIAPEDFGRIFERFYRVDQARSAEKGGTGLGLPITRRIIELHGGQVQVESELGKGSRFRISVPIKE